MKNRILSTIALPSTVLIALPTCLALNITSNNCQIYNGMTIKLQESTHAYSLKEYNYGGSVAVASVY